MSVEFVGKLVEFDCNKLNSWEVGVLTFVDTNKHFGIKAGELVVRYPNMLGFPQTHNYCLLSTDGLKCRYLASDEKIKCDVVNNKIVSTLITTGKNIKEIKANCMRIGDIGVITRIDADWSSVKVGDLVIRSGTSLVFPLTNTWSSNIDGCFVRPLTDGEQVIFSNKEN